MEENEQADLWVDLPQNQVSTILDEENKYFWQTSTHSQKLKLYPKKVFFTLPISSCSLESWPGCPECVCVCVCVCVCIFMFTYSV